MDRLEIKVAGMSCGHCVGSVDSALRKVEGVRVENVGVGSANISYDPAVTAPAAIAQAIEDTGYTAVSLNAA